MRLWLLPAVPAALGAAGTTAAAGGPAPSWPVCPLLPSGSCITAARVATLQQALGHFPFNKQAKEKGPASPRANYCPMFLLEVMDCRTGISRPRVSGQAAVSKITPPSSLHAHHTKINVDAISNQSSVPANGSAARDSLLPSQQKDLLE